MLDNRTLKVTKKEDKNHDSNNKLKENLHISLDENIEFFNNIMKDCDDVVKRKFPIGEDRKIWAFIAYIDVMVDRRVIEESVMEQLIVYDRGVPENKSLVSMFELIKDGGMATADIKEVTTFDDITAAVMSGDTIVMVDGFNKGVVISTRGWPSRGIPETDTENVVRGSKESFSEVFRFNTVLIRRRIRDTKLKVKQLQKGIRSRTDIGLMYLEDVVRPDVLAEVEKRLDSFKIDGILDSGIVEQFIEDNWYSPFPQIQITQRPDKAASAILEGRIAIIVDNTPFVLLVPSTINCFFQASEDYYSRWSIMSFVRILRYIAAFFALALPGLYIAITTFHPAMIPSSLTFSIAATHQGVPFPAALEVIIMEIAFELLREAGTRLPGPIGSTIGIVGGLIIGQASVEANLISPIIVIIVALTAISSFAIPSDSVVTGLRIFKYLVIVLSSILGLFGFIVSILILLIHLTSLKSFNIPYMSPYEAHEINQGDDVKDSLIRLPLFLYKRRPFFSRPEERVRLKMDHKNKE